MPAWYHSVCFYPNLLSSSELIRFYCLTKVSLPFLSPNWKNQAVGYLKMWRHFHYLACSCIYLPILYGTSFSKGSEAYLASKHAWKVLRIKLNMQTQLPKELAVGWAWKSWNSARLHTPPLKAVRRWGRESSRFHMVDSNPGPALSRFRTSGRSQPTAHKGECYPQKIPKALWKTIP